MPPRTLSRVPLCPPPQLDLSGTHLGLPEIELLCLRILSRSGPPASSRAEAAPSTPAAEALAAAAPKGSQLPLASKASASKASAPVPSPASGPRRSEAFAVVPARTGPALCEVLLAGCGLGPEAARVVCETLQGVKKVQVLDLSGNAINLEGGQAAAAMVASTPTLRVIRLAGCRLQWSKEMVEFRARRKNKGPPPEPTGAFDPAVRGSVTCTAEGPVYIQRFESGRRCFSWNVAHCLSTGARSHLFLLILNFLHHCATNPSATDALRRVGAVRAGGRCEAAAAARGVRPHG